MIDPWNPSMLLLGATFGGGGAGAGSGSWTLLVIYFCLAIGVSFFCSVWEAVLLSVTQPYVAHLKEGRPRAGAVLEELKETIGRPLAAILTLNTVAHTLGSMGVAAQVKALGGGIWEAVAGGVMTLSILVASEIIPKNLGAKHWRAWGPWVGFCLKWLTRLMGPVVWTIEHFSGEGERVAAFSRQELRMMAEMGRQEGKLKENESRILENLLQLRENSVVDVMTPRVVVFALPEEDTVGDFVTNHGDTPFSRIPIYRENREHITGFVLKDDVLLEAARDHHETRLVELQRELPSLAGQTALMEAFEQLMKGRHHISVVRDEFGGVAGLVTMEDIVETLLGLEIVDEADTKEDLRVWARSLWEKRAAKMGINLEHGNRRIAGQ